MRLNPFSQAFGKRRAAMIDGADPALDEMDSATGYPAYDEQTAAYDEEIMLGEPEPTDDPIITLRNIKRFGFARRPDGSVIKAESLMAENDDAHKAPVARERQSDHVGIQQQTQQPQPDRQAPPDSQTIEPDRAPATPRPRSAHQQRLEAIGIDTSRRNAARPQNVAPSAPIEPQGIDGPVVSSPHIDRLRAEFGDPAQDNPPPSPRQADMATEPGLSPQTDTDQPHYIRKDAANGPALTASRQGPLRDEADPPSGMAAWAGQPQEASVPDPVDEGQDDMVPAIIDDIAVTIGRVVSIRGSVIWGALFDDVAGQASKAARMGALVSMRGPDSRVFGIVNLLQREQVAGSAQAERTTFEVQILGEIADSSTGFQRGVSSYPPLDAPVTTITLRDIATIYARPRTSNVHIGQLRHNAKVPAFVLTDSLLGKHFAVLGTTGAGKSCATTVILRSILDEHPEGHVVLLDPHNEYGPAFADRAELLNPSNLQLPYWLLNYEEIAHILLGNATKEHLDTQGALLKDAIVRAKRVFAGDDHTDSQITVDMPLPYRLSDLVATLKEGMGMLNKAEGSARYLGLISRIESLRADKRYAFMFSSLAVRDNMQQILAQLLRIPTRGKPITIIDISGLPSEVVDVVVSVLFRLTFELAVWSERGKAPPVLLVCEEAHRYVPEASGVGFAPTKRVISRIAKEGRKYGVTLCLVSQRPSELATNSLTQCNTIFALRLSNEHDQAFVAQTLSENARWLVDSLPSLNTQEAVVVGDGVTVPVHIRFKELAPEHRPASHDPSFATSWRREADDAFLGDAIERWRRQAR
jgi:DNA helicase HerA-like ATPase